MRATVMTALAWLASFGTVQAVSAQAGTSSPLDPIVVTARPLPAKRETLRWFRMIAGHPNGSEPLSRMTQPLCIGGVGLRRDMVLGIADRIMGNAMRLGIELGGEKCSPNVLVLFVENGADQVKWLADHRPGIFGRLQASEVSAMIRDKGPVHVWHITAITSRDGDRIMQFGNELPTLTIPSASRIDLPIKSRIAAAVMLIDRNAVYGKSINQIGDYASMRLLAEVRPRNSEAVPSILSLFDTGSSAPEAMTPFDWGYLRGLYAGQGNKPPAFQFADMARFVDEEIKNGAAKP